MAAYTEEEKRSIGEHWAAGKTWREIGKLVPDVAGKPRSAETIQRCVRRARQKGEWPPPGLQGTRQQPDGKSGRPRNLRRTRKVSPRFCPGVHEVLITLAEATGMRTGEVIDEALTRDLSRKQGSEVDRLPLGFDPGKVVKIDGGARSVTMSCAVDLKTFEELRAHYPGRKDNSIIHTIALALLRDLNYEVVKP